MYTGTLITDLMATVERAETSIRVQPEQELQLTYRYVIALTELAHLDAPSQLAGVA
jgi:hypothetical protein